jgi:hypothetical protein
MVMKVISKKKIRGIVEDAMERMLFQMKISSPSNKTRRLIKQAAKELSSPLKDDIKKQMRKSLKAEMPLMKKEKVLKVEIQN